MRNQEVGRQVRSALVVDLAPWPEPAGSVSVAGLAEPLRARFGTAAIWHLAAGQPAPPDATDAGLGAVILSGSAAMLDAPPDWIPALAAALDGWMARRVPLLATCFGHQFVAAHLGGTIASFATSHVGLAPLHIREPDPLLNGVAPAASLFWSHRDYVATLPPDLVPIAAPPDGPIEAYRHRALPLWGLQAHPESSPALSEAIRSADAVEGQRIAEHPLNDYATPAGAQVLRNFAALAAARGAAAQARASS